MYRREPVRKTVLVTDAGRGSAIAIIRSLNRKGWRVIAAAADRLSPGFYSRHTADRVLYPSPTKAADHFVETMLASVKERDVDLIIPVTEETILPLINARQEFEAVCCLALPESRSLELTRDKLQTLELANRLQVPIPCTVLVQSVGEALDRASELQWPLVLKPIVSRKYDSSEESIEEYSVRFANNLEGLKREMGVFEGRCSVLLQEYHRGHGEGVELLACEGQPLAAFQHRRLCEVPLHGGASALRESVDLDPQLYEYARRLTEAMNWTGLLMVEFKVGDEGARLMEINGRVWGSLPLAVMSGMDFPGRLADLYESGSAAPVNGPATDYAVGLQAANLKLLLNWLVQVLWGRRSYEFLPWPTRREALPVFLKLFDPRLEYDVMSLSDPRPGMVRFLRIGRKFFRKLKALWKPAKGISA